MGTADEAMVVVGCDGSWHSNRAVEMAAREAERRGCRLTLLVVPRDDLPARDEPLSGYGAAQAQGLSRARVVGDLARERALATAPTVPTDTVVDEIDGLAVRALARRAVLLVLGRSGHGGERALSMSSTSNALLRRLPVPVMIPGTSPSIGSAVPHAPRVVVGVDGRGGEEELIGVAAAEAAVRGCGLVIVRAVLAQRAGGGISRPEVWDDTWMAVHGAERAASVSSRVVVTVDEPVAALTGECGPGDLLVVGTRGQGRLAGLVSGSVARGVLDAGACDVMVVPPGARTMATQDSAVQ